VVLKFLQFEDFKTSIKNFKNQGKAYFFERDINKATKKRRNQVKANIYIKKEKRQRSTGQQRKKEEQRKTKRTKKYNAIKPKRKEEKRQRNTMQQRKKKRGP
jgi:hypothetical protein